MITVYDDAPEQNKELKERGTTDARRLCFRAVGEPRPPVPEPIVSSLLTILVYFLVLFSQKTMLSDALVSTVST